MDTPIKIVLLGDSGVGKTSIIYRFVLNKFDMESPSTHVAGFISKSMMVPKLSGTVRFQIWDTAGQEKYQSMAEMYYKDAEAAIVVFDMTRMDSYEGLKRWVGELKEKGPEKIHIVIAGNKSDLIAEQEVKLETVTNYAEEVNAEIKIVSAKQNVNVTEIFTDIATELRKTGIESMVC